MRGIPSSILFFFFAFIFLLEFVSFIGVRILLSRLKSATRIYITVLYLLLTAIIVGLLLYSFANPEVIRQSQNYYFFYLVISLSFLNLVPKSIFSFATAFSYIIRWLAGKWWQMIALSGSLLLSFGVFTTILFGIVADRYHIRVEKQDLYFDNLPEQLEGLRIVQISDLHLGSFGKNTASLDNAGEIINILQPDLLLFTGDIVNNFSDEIDGFESSLGRWSARLGKFAIQGNHDYGDYSEWPDSFSKQKNLEEIENGVARSGFKLLQNEWERIEVKDTALVLIGVENWGHGPFPQYANLDQASMGISGGMFRILMTHDPAHWTSVVTTKTDIPLTLSGHTHGGQFGLRIAGIEFSPMYIISKTWGGLYQSDIQYLYVNRGFGTIGFSGRVEMRPEITLLTLHRTKNH